MRHPSFHLAILLTLSAAVTFGSLPAPALAQQPSTDAPPENPAEGDASDERPPDADLPDQDLPDRDLPDTDLPDQELPDQDLPSGQDR